MKQETMYGAIAAIALVLALVAIGMVVMGSGNQQLAGITYDPSKQPSLLPLRDLTSSTDSVSGIIVDFQKVNTSGATGSPYIGQLVMLSGDTWINADASTTMTGKLGIVVKAPTTNTSATGQILLQGVVRNSSWTLTKGTTYYANATTPGTFGSVKPNGAAVIQPIGYGINTTVLLFDPVVNVTANGM